MTPEQFIEKWHASTLKERSASQSHFNDLCTLLGVQNPTDADPKGESYCFERGASKTAGGEGWADVWKRNHFGWEYKGKRKDLTAAYAQLQQYAVALENPPLLVVSDMDRIVVHTNWTNTVSEKHTIALEDLKDANKRDLLRAAFTDPERLKPKKTIDALTRDVADKFAGLAIRLREAGHAPQAVAHFVNRLVFCMFAEDINLLPRRLFSQILDRAKFKPEIATAMLGQLFEAMRAGGLFGVDEIEWFNGGLFDDSTALPLKLADIKTIAEAADMDWSDIDPSIFGTLFERGLDPAKRSQLGAHYTDPEKIMMIVRPVIIEPLWREWEAVKAQIEKPKTSEKAKRQLLGGFLERLREFRVLDPACGSGNFLYLALLALKDIEHRVNLEAEAMGLGRQFPTVGPEAVRGIELNPYAAELARVTIWIGEIQWMRKNGFDVSRKPILKPLQNIENRDALLNDDGTEAEWPNADVIIGNPPFLGNKKLIGGLGEAVAANLRNVFPGSGAYDLVTYWFRKSIDKSKDSPVRVGFVATQSIRQGANREVLDRISLSNTITDAWADEPWNVDGAAVRVSLICFATHGLTIPPYASLNGQRVDRIFSDLKGTLGAARADLTEAKPLKGNRGIVFQGPVKVGAFDISGELARDMLQKIGNPNGRPNSDVIRPWRNGMDITRRPSDTWIIDFAEMSEADASLYEAPFEYVRKVVKPERDRNRDKQRRTRWWRLGRSGGDLRRASGNINRCIFTPRVAKYRIFVWAPTVCLPDSRLYAFARDDDVSFGILHSRFHEIWSIATSSRHGVGNDPTYNSASCFETFVFPAGLEPDRALVDYQNPHAESIAQAAKRLNELRETWLNPPDLVKPVPEVVTGFPDRIEPVGVAATAELKKRTLTNLYNARPAWLANAHKALDEAVSAAYGWPTDLSDDAILHRLLKLNQERNAEKGGSA